ncbi:hypothetical protein BDZ91DRAFT_53039 [Kalaharituber pfeilii]|nr:hypothetical protein BDZ91DRAFT_53039 [Kalaharituber pfeilii]
MSDDNHNRGPPNFPPFPFSNLGVFPGFTYNASTGNAAPPSRQIVEFNGSDDAGEYHFHQEQYSLIPPQSFPPAVFSGISQSMTSAPSPRNSSSTHTLISSAAGPDQVGLAPGRLLESMERERERIRNEVTGLTSMFPPPLQTPTPAPPSGLRPLFLAPVGSGPGQRSGSGTGRMVMITTSLSGPQRLGGTPSDPHGVTNRTGTPRFSPTRSTQAFSASSASTSSQRQDQRRRIMMSHSRSTNQPSTPSTPSSVPTSGPLLDVLIRSLKECRSDYNSVAEFVQTNYPDLTQRSQSQPRFLIAGRPHPAPPNPLTMRVLIERILERHLDRRELDRTRPPDWERYMVLAVELKWVETGLCVGGFEGDILDRVWENGHDRAGSGVGGRYVERDVKRLLEEVVWRDVARRFLWR